jgi:phosphoglycolate phosphatase
MRAAIFDLDGTLADTSADLIAAANAALAAAGFGAPLDPVADAAHAFRGGRAMLRAGLSRVPPAEDAETVVERLYPALLDHYADSICRETRLYAGAEAALERLEAAGWLLAICTNKPIALADLLLAELGIAARFRVVLGADSLAVRKPDPVHLLETIARAGGRPDRAVMVGDTETDRDVARAAGIPCVLVGFGPEGHGVTRLAPEAVLAHYEDLPDLLDTLAPLQRQAG